MNHNFSIFLDCVRATAALIVLGSHVSNPRLQGEWIAWAHQFGHEAVIVFFVLSGLVIGYVSQHREHFFQPFMEARFARLWSVAIPALLFTYFADSVGHWLEPGLYSADWYYDNNPILRLVASALFVNELWFKQIAPLSDGPFWSLSYEFWYYVIFSSFYFFTGTKRILLITIALLIVGPKILLLWPVWMMGLLAWMIIERQLVGDGFAMMVGWLALGMLVWSQVNDIESSFYYLLSMPLLTEYQPILEWRMSARFFSDWVDGALLAMVFLGINAFFLRLKNCPHRLSMTIRYVANATLFIYLFHFPLIYLLHAIGTRIGLQTDGGIQAWVAIVSLVFLLVFGPMLERTKFFWRRWVHEMFECGKAACSRCWIVRG
ncbi:MAG: acyltransferase family protein [Mariprofundales bacterium]